MLLRQFVISHTLQGGLKEQKCELSWKLHSVKSTVLVKMYKKMYLFSVVFAIDLHN